MSQEPTPAGGATEAPSLHASPRARRFERRTLDAPLTIQLETTRIEGTADNVSRVGLMLYTDEPLRVTVQVEGFQGGRPLEGRLIRVQRMDDEVTGFAIEFDELIDLTEED